MPEGNKPFVVTDRRKFTMDGEVRPDADRPEETRAPRVEPSSATEAGSSGPAPLRDAGAGNRMRLPRGDGREEQELPAPTAEQMEQSKRAFEQTAERIETAIRATNPGMEHPPAMNFEQLVQSVYLTAIMQLGGATQEGEQPRVDLLGAKSSIDMIGVLAEKTAGNLGTKEQAFLDSAIFELRMAFLEMTQALARSAQARQGGPARSRWRSGRLWRWNGRRLWRGGRSWRIWRWNADAGALEECRRRLRFLGSGTSMGVPTLGCGCAVCTSTDPHNRRTRPSVRLEYATARSC